MGKEDECGGCRSTRDESPGPSLQRRIVSKATARTAAGSALMRKSTNGWPRLDRAQEVGREPQIGHRIVGLRAGHRDPGAPSGSFRAGTPPESLRTTRSISAAKSLGSTWSAAITAWMMGSRSAVARAGSRRPPPAPGRCNASRQPLRGLAYRRAKREGDQSADRRILRFDVDQCRSRRAG